MREDVVAARNTHQPETETLHQLDHVAKRHVLQRALGQALKQPFTIYRWANSALLSGK